MIPTPDILLSNLPQYRDEWIVINENQTVPDIIDEVIESHREFSTYYDKIAPYFIADDTQSTCDRIYDFLKHNVRYIEEGEEEQTSALPTGILTRGYGDCKHYSGFSAGILDAIGRLTGKPIKWNYRFASYNPVKKTPHHVFVVVNDSGREIWIDPTPGAVSAVPVWQIDKTVKGNSMSSKNNISGIDDAIDTLSAIGKASLVLTPRVNINPLNWNYSNHYPGIFNPYLGLSQYRDEGGDRNLNEEQIASELNALIGDGPSPGHTVTGDWVRWVYETNLRSWNFYYPGGVAPGFNPSSQLPANYPRLTITEDGRLNFDRDVKIDDYKNPEVHLLTAWAQEIINQYDPSPYPVKPQHLKNFSQGLEGNHNTRNLFTEARGDSIFKEIGKALEDAVNFIKDGIVTIVGFLPRNAFLGLVGLNAFGFATNMWERIQDGQWDSIKDKWEKLGGNADKLYNTIEDGKEKNAILGNADFDFDGAYIGAEPVTTSTGALLAAAAPIIAALLAFLDKDGKVKEVLSATKGFLSQRYPNLDLTAFGFLDKNTGKYLEFEADPRYNENLGANNPGNLPTTQNPFMSFVKENPVIVAAGGAVVTFLLTNKKGQKPNYILPLVAGAGLYFILQKQSGTATNMLPGGNQQQRQQLLQWGLENSSAGSAEGEMWKKIIPQMSDSEISDTWSYIFNYVMKGVSLDAMTNKPLYDRVQMISDKYQIFT